MSDDICPSSTPPPSPHGTPQPILTPITYQFHPSTIPSYPSFPLNTTSPNYYPTQIHPSYPPAIIQQGSFGSINSMTSMPQPASQPVESITTRSKNPNKSNARGVKSQSSTSRKNRAKNGKPPKSPSSGTQQKKGKKSQKGGEDGPVRKPPVKWEDQKNEKGESAISILLNWITTYENWTRYKSHTNYKSATLESITSYLVENGIHGRNEKIVATKISTLEAQFNEAKRWIDQTGQGAMGHLEAEKEKNGWEDEDPAYIARKKVLVDEPVMGQRDKATRLASVNSAHPDNPNDSLECLGLGLNVDETRLEDDFNLDQSQRSLPSQLDIQNDNEHSEASNQEYHRLQAKAEIDNDLGISNEDLRRLLDDNVSEDLSLKLIPKESAKQTPKPTIDLTAPPSVSESATKPSVKKRYSHKASAESKVKELLDQKSETVKSSINQLEDSVIKSSLKTDSLGNAIKELATIFKPKDDPRLLLSKEDQIKQAQLDAQLHGLKVESAQLDLKRTKQAMDIDYRIARGKFIAQIMAENHLTLEQAKEVAAEVFPNTESEKPQS